MTGTESDSIPQTPHGRRLSDSSNIGASAAEEVYPAWGYFDAAYLVGAATSGRAENVNKSSTPSELMSQSLLENALDFLAHGVQELTDDTLPANSLKYGLLHTAMSVEVFFKKRLFDEHWSLVFADVNKASKQALRTGSFRSVQFADCQKRLKEVCGVDLSSHDELLKSLYSLRNRMVHFEFSIERVAAISILVKTWSMLQDFVYEHINLDEIPDGRGLFKAISSGMQVHDNFCVQRNVDIAPKLKALKKDGAIFIGCPRCLSDSLPLTGQDTECLFCRHAFPRDELRDEWLITFVGWHVFEDPKDEMIEPHIRRCPECGEENLCRDDDSFRTRDHADWTCFNCTGQWSRLQLDDCNYCGELYEHHGHELHGCPDCLRPRLEMDNT